MSFLTRLRYKLPNLLRPPHNLAEYRAILSSARQKGYAFLTLREFMLATHKPSGPFIILRHDIDSDPRTALRFAEIEESLGVRASYFFRLKTWQPPILNLLHRRGHEAGYHMEELTSHAVRHHLKKKQMILNALPQIKREFAANLARLRQTLDFPLDAVAAHGDFTYPVLDLGNRLVLKDEALRRKLGILYEAYDEELMAAYQNHVSDKPAPWNFHPAPPQEYIARGDDLLFLSHPRWWQPRPLGNLISDLGENLRRLRW